MGRRALRDIADTRFAAAGMWMHRFNGLGILDRFGVADAFRP